MLTDCGDMHSFWRNEELVTVKKNEGERVLDEALNDTAVAGKKVRKKE